MQQLPKLTQQDFKNRRDHLAKLMEKNSIAIIATRDEMYRNRDADYKYRPDSSFYYLTGFAEPEAVAVIETDDRGGYQYTLFCRERDREMEIWNGYRAGTLGAVEQFGADEAFEINTLSEKILTKIANKSVLYYRIGLQPSFDQELTQWIAQIDKQQRAGLSSPARIQHLDRLVDEMRLIKSEAELVLMRTAAKISAEAHQRAMSKVYSGMMEYQLEAEINYVFGQYGCVASYNSIVGGGENGCILHYVENNKVLKDGDLVLIDAGAEYQYYAGDITRTFPVNGQFTAEQRALYEVVLNAQMAAIEQVKIGHHYRQPHEVAVRILSEGLLDLGLLSGELNEVIETEKYRQFFMHGTGHWLGLDVHDVGQYKTVQGEWRALQENMVLTIEPGLYIAPDDITVDARWRGIGIRIEDDVVVKTGQVEILTADVVKSIEDIEYLMRSKSEKV